MKRSLLIGCVIISIGLMGLSGCAKKVEDEIAISNTEMQNLPVSEPAASPASGITPKLSEEVAREMQKAKSIEGIKTITLRDIEGNVVEHTFTDEAIKAIETAFNESFIMDTAHVEMIAGLTMNIELENGKTVFIYSYGEEKYIVATIGDGPSYHLGCELIGKILLEDNEK